MLTCRWSGTHGVERCRAKVLGEEQSGDSESGAIGVSFWLAEVLGRLRYTTVTWFARVLGPEATSALRFTHRLLHTGRAAGVHGASY
ncbi:hypothetical protein RHMOL_Rhmol04G0200400 [Rhododendron molle]|uniref:Uncharacterized protein n=1 Tax=Rhododendron molle TaxID=49168 RepID=A0ACC0P2D7_RHOML|nr:hypothetical protein RHMOL_Rhmol04G0200400 [Rhododendron molle]